MAWDDLWLGVICQSNPEIAGSPRNIFRYSARLIFCVVERLDDFKSESNWDQLNSEYAKILSGSQSRRDKPVQAKGKHPRFPSKVPKWLLSGKGRWISNTVGRLAQKQPSFKECVTAHLNIPSDSEGEIRRLKWTELNNLPKTETSLCEVVGELPDSCEGKL